MIPAGFDGWDVVLVVVGFLCFVASLPSEAEIRTMTFRQVLYAIPYRFLNQLSVNARVIPGIGAIVSQVEQTRTTANAKGNIVQLHQTETTGVLAPETKGHP